MKYCEFNGCTNKVSNGAYCEDHKRSKKSRMAKQKKQSKSIYHHANKSFYNSDPWKAMRSYVYEREHGCCQLCGRFIFGRRAHVHHMVPIKANPLLALDENNLMLLCPTCHTIEENKDKEKKEKVFPSYFGPKAPPTQK